MRARARRTSAPPALCFACPLTRPRHPHKRHQDLQQHQIVAATGITPSVEWKFGDGEQATTVRIKPRMTVTTNDGAIETVRQWRRHHTPHVLPSHARLTKRRITNRTQVNTISPTTNSHRAPTKGARAQQRFAALSISWLRLCAGIVRWGDWVRSLD